MSSMLVGRAGRHIPFAAVVPAIVTCRDPAFIHLAHEGCDGSVSLVERIMHMLHLGTDASLAMRGRLHDDLAENLARLHRPFGLGDVAKSDNPIDDWRQPSVGDQ